MVISNHHASLSCPSPQLEPSIQYCTDYDYQPCSPALSTPMEPTHLEASKYFVLYKCQQTLTPIALGVDGHQHQASSMMPMVINSTFRAHVDNWASQCIHANDTLSLCRASVQPLQPINLRLATIISSQPHIKFHVCWTISLVMPITHNIHIYSPA